MTLEDITNADVPFIHNSRKEVEKRIKYLAENEPLTEKYTREQLYNMHGHMVDGKGLGRAIYKEFPGITHKIILETVKEKTGKTMSLTTLSNICTGIPKGEEYVRVIAKTFGFLEPKEY